MLNWRNAIKLTLTVHALGLLVAQPGLTDEAIGRSMSQPIHATSEANSSASVAPFSQSNQAATSPSRSTSNRSIDEAANPDAANPGAANPQPTATNAPPQGTVQASDAPTCYWYASGYCRCF
ncbi:MAG TPA: hypothetical protein V6D10_09140 [Trichocoleus sp.]|jgi:hypothetical protein